jgi:Ca-activated chloride channel family protein
VRFLAPDRLLLLLLPLALAVGYAWLARRRRHHAVRLPTTRVLAAVSPRRPGWRRHGPAAVALLSLVLLVVALARPARDERVPREAAVVVLAVDVSASMTATDVAPSRIDAAVAAATEFVDDVPERFQLGLVAFDGRARVLATPTVDHGAVRAALQRLSPGEGTAAGDGIGAALDAVAASLEAAGAEGGDGQDLPASIVLLSDGATTVGRSVESAAREAADAGVPVSTIAFGTDRGAVVVGGEVVPVPADREAMEAVADITGGTSAEAETAGELRDVYDDIGARVGSVVEEREIARAFLGVALVALFAAVAGSFVWSARLP